MDVLSSFLPRPAQPSGNAPHNPMPIYLQQQHPQSGGAIESKGENDEIEFKVRSVYSSAASSKKEEL